MTGRSGTDYRRCSRGATPMARPRYRLNGSPAPSGTLATSEQVLPLRRRRHPPQRHPHLLPVERPLQHHHVRLRERHPQPPGRAAVRGVASTNSDRSRLVFRYDTPEPSSNISVTTSPADDRPDHRRHARPAPPLARRDLPQRRVLRLLRERHRLRRRGRTPCRPTGRAPGSPGPGCRGSSRRGRRRTAAGRRRPPNTTVRRTTAARSTRRHRPNSGVGGRGSTGRPSTKNAGQPLRVRRDQRQGHQQQVAGHQLDRHVVAHVEQEHLERRPGRAAAPRAGWCGG